MTMSIRDSYVIGLFNQGLSRETISSECGLSKGVIQRIIWSNLAEVDISKLPYQWQDVARERLYWEQIVGVKIKKHNDPYGNR